MNIEGTYTLQATPEVVWGCLTNKPVLLTSIPTTGYAEQDDTAYKLALQMPQGDTYHAHLHLTEQETPEGLYFTLKGDDSPAAFNGQGTLRLVDNQTHTTVVYEGMLDTSSTEELGDPLVLKGAAKLLIQQFFAQLEEQIHAQNRRQGKIVPIPGEQKTEGRNIFYTAVQWLHLGGGDSLEEARWTLRMQRISIVAGLLLLVWVGIRLPRRH